jgi:uncharacterized protein YbbC (DUF1343 family)
VAARWSSLLAFVAALLALAGCGPSAPSPTRSYASTTSAPPTTVHIRLGSEVLAAQNFAILAGKRIGLLTNPSGVNSRGQSIIDVLHRAPNVKLVALFAGEHGLHGDIPAGREFKDQTDPGTGLPVFSLYGPGPVRAPTPAMLGRIDALVYDLQDVGCRSYTFIASMGAAMEACGRAGKEFIVLDRPNPLGGLRVEGNLLSPEIDRLDSLVARWNVPYVYGMTTGELARMIVGEHWINPPCKLIVVPMAGWRRDMVWRDTGLPWVPTSPHVPHANTPLYYVATGILGELGGVNIGMRMDKQFEIVAAPWLNADRFAARMNGYGLYGTHFSPYRGQSSTNAIQGVEIHFTDPAQAQLMAVNFYVLDAVKREANRDLFADAMHRGASFAMFDKVNGTAATRLALQAGRSPTQIVQSWARDEAAFRQRRAKYLIYP